MADEPKYVVRINGRWHLVKENAMMEPVHRIKPAFDARAEMEQILGHPVKEEEISAEEMTELIRLRRTGTFVPCRVTDDGEIEETK
jgi:hypothetical protein